MDEELNGHLDDGVHQKVEENEIKAELHDDIDDEVVSEESIEANVNGNETENGKEEKDLDSFSSSSSDAKVIVTEKTTDDDSAVINKEENEAWNLIVEEENDEDAEIESKPVTEKLEEVVEEDISEVAETSDEEKGYNTVQEEEREVVITEEAHQTIELEPVVMELADVVSDHVESAEKGTNEKLKTAEEDSFPAIAKTGGNGTDESAGPKGEIPETNGNPIISISARTMQPTSWKGCCGLLEVFKRGDR